jgi:hypothetical protein
LAVPDVYAVITEVESAVVEQIGEILELRAADPQQRSMLDAYLSQIPFPPAPFDASAKVPAIDSFVGENAVAWVDDIVTPEAQRWSQKRTSPTLLVEVDHALGLTRDAIDELLTLD